ncbi:membrane protein DedA with SNARE-associated domain [Phyllobacterium ifriqiyense]|uniref:Membrane protein DedA with SNARE-associated domain n=1 Tax=Phyllobacterium ifriqiyense TaxID=314238 RepID=A0ABU0S9A4_9HYPH|nr:VTT domain-containing protein [Phyllobacterium ifriqiyense]MDQ0996308.1 membrane protein DedA with SNARE-associated domain [Phyllobacterium ifriqiyense]
MDPLGNLIDWIALYGIFGLIAMGMAERFVPAIPSYGVLVAIGIAAAEDVWSVPAAVVGTAIGSFVGASSLYLAVRALGTKRSTSLLYWIGKWIGLSHGRIDKSFSYLHTRERMLTIVSQLIPTVRLISPVIAGLVQIRPSKFMAGSAVGILIWNSFFIAAGHFVVLVVPDINSSVLALKVLALLVVTEALVALGWRLQSLLPRLLATGGNK